ncbi:MAG: hypothetical protein IKH57_22505 [Clostridia bacterium]|nr:hypothetical protein [Clostridia bacterium]
MTNWVIELLHEIADLLEIDREKMMRAALKAAIKITKNDADGEKKEVG